MNPPKMPIHIGDLLRDTGHLRAMLFGAYMLLLFHHWSTGSLPDDDEQLSAIARLTPAEWKKARPILVKFFEDGWHHGRVEEDLASAKASYEKRAKAGEKGGKAKAESKQSSSNATAGPEQPLTFNQSKKDSEAIASDARASDPRSRLFNEGIGKLASLTGKGPDSCRSFLGKCLKEAGDDAIVVLAAIEDAERNQVIDPSGYIVRILKGRNSGSSGSKIIQAADDLRRKIASFDGPASGEKPIRSGEGAAAIRLLPHG